MRAPLAVKKTLFQKKCNEKAVASCAQDKKHLILSCVQDKIKREYGIISLLTIDNRTSLLENIVALKLLANYGTKEAVYFYNHGIEIDFYIPHIETAIQVSYSINDTEGTFEREVNALVKVQSRLSCRNNIIVTYGEESIIEKGGVRIEVIPVWKFLLNFDK